MFIDIDPRDLIPLEKEYLDEVFECFERTDQRDRLTSPVAKAARHLTCSPNIDPV